MNLLSFVLLALYTITVPDLSGQREIKNGQFNFAQSYRRSSRFVPTPELPMDVGILRRTQNFQLHSVPAAKLIKINPTKKSSNEHRDPNGSEFRPQNAIYFSTFKWINPIVDPKFLIQTEIANKKIPKIIFTAPDLSDTIEDINLI
ncbi:hypothetical protein SSS_09519 [Sarcoptes scabiei]|nr:hypothetical protein SSS_09519 [Sarcoptes scabiei]